MLGNEETHEHEYVEGAYPRESSTGWRRLSWGAILAGTLVTIATFVTLQMLGAGIGLSTVDLTGREVSSASGLGIGAAVWWFITGLIALFIGGWVAGRLGWLPNKIDRILHGLTTWALFYTVMFLLVTTTVSALAGGGLAMLGQGLSGAGQAAGSPQVQQAAGQAMESRGLSPDIIRQEIAGLMGAGNAQQGQPGGNLVGAIGDYFRGEKTPQERQQLAQAIAQATGRSEAQANQTIDNLERRAQQAKETGEQAANITGGTLIGLAIAMLLGAAAAMLGSLLAPAPPIPAYRRTTGVRTEAGTYVSR